MRRRQSPFDDDDDDSDNKDTTTAELETSTELLIRQPVAEDGEERPPLVRVQRRYQTFRWKYGHDDDEAAEYDVNYRAEGPEDGPPVLLVHGFGANANHFRFQFPVLVAEGYRVYAVDLLGFGASDKPADVPYSIELFARLLQDFVTTVSTSSRQVQRQPWFLAGNSIGGLCCLALAAALPDDAVRGVVLFNCSGGMTGFRYDDVPYYLRPVLFVLQRVILNPALGGKSFFARFKTRENVYSILTEQGVYRDTTHVDEELLEILLGPSEDDGAQDVFLKVFGGPPGPTPESLLPSVRCPVLLQWGDSDPWTPLDGGAHPVSRLAACYTGPSWTLDVLHETGHCPHDERPERVHRVLLPWLKRQMTRESHTTTTTTTPSDGSSSMGG